MKKLLSLVGIVALSAVFASVVNAQLSISELFSGKEALNAGSYAKLLNEYDSSWGYTSFDVIEGEMTGGVLSIISPIVVDEDISVVEEYRLIISPYRVNALKTLDSKVDLSNIIMKTARLESNGTGISFELSEEGDRIDPEVGYYGVIVPLDMYDTIGTPSEELCFQLSSNLFEWDQGCDAFELVVTPAPVEDNNGNADVSNANTENNAAGNTEDNIVNNVAGNMEGNVGGNAEGNMGYNEEYNNGSHGAACAGMNLANVSHSVKGDTITLTWTAVDGDSVQIAIFDPEDEVYKSLGTVDMSAEKFTYKMKWNGEQNFMLTNGCKEVYYKADAAVKAAEPIEATPATGPAENVLYIAIATIVLYGAYVVFFKKADNK